MLDTVFTVPITPVAPTRATGVILLALWHPGMLLGTGLFGFTVLKAMGRRDLHNDLMGAVSCD